MSRVEGDVNSIDIQFDHPDNFAAEPVTTVNVVGKPVQRVSMHQGR